MSSVDTMMNRKQAAAVAVLDEFAEGLFQHLQAFRAGFRERDMVWAGNALLDASKSIRDMRRRLDAIVAGNEDAERVAEEFSYGVYLDAEMLAEAAERDDVDLARGALNMLCGRLSAAAEELRALLAERSLSDVMRDLVASMQSRPEAQPVAS